MSKSSQMKRDSKPSDPTCRIHGGFGRGASRDSFWQSGSGRYSRPSVVLLLAIHAALLVNSANCNSPVFDEIVRVGAGIHLWHSGDFSRNPGNPPLNDLVASGPVMLLTNMSERIDFAEKLMTSHDAVRFVLLSRLVLVPFSLFGGWICFKWSTELFGRLAGLLVLALWCFEPLTLAYGALNTGDMVATSMGIAATYAFWRWIRRPHISGAAGSGIALGFALLAKYVWVILPVLWLAIWLVRRWASTSLPKTAWRWQFLVMTLTAVYVVNAGFGFDQSFKPLNSYEFRSDFLKRLTLQVEGNSLSGVGVLLRRIPIPFPRYYLTGIDAIASHVQMLPMRTYVHGEFLDGHVWYFYLYALLVKMPLGTWLLLGIAVYAKIRDRDLTVKSRETIANNFNSGESGKATTGEGDRPSASDWGGWFTDFVLWVPAITILVFVSWVTSYKFLRYALPMLPFVFIWIGHVVVWAQEGGKWRRCIVWGSLAISVVSSLATYPHSLSYFNEAAGGSRNGDAHLLGPNFDYGQDFLHLKDWIGAHPDAQPLYVECHNYTDPKIVGIESARVPLNGPQPGWYALSGNVLRGSLWRESTSALPLRSSYEYLESFRDEQPVGHAGYSIQIYRLDCEQANAMRAMLGLGAIDCGEDNSSGLAEQ